MSEEKLGFEDDLMLGVRAGGGRMVLQVISSHLAQRTRVSASVILEGLLDREALGSTGFGGGFALPHAFIPGLIAPAKVLVTLREPIEFNAPDDEPVDIFLAVAWPYGQHEGFLHYLSKLSGVFRSKKLLAILREVRSETEALIVLSAAGCATAPGSKGSVTAPYGPVFR